MGIKNLNSLLKERSPSAFQSIPLKLLQGGKIAIDATNLSYIMMATATKAIVEKTNLVTNDPDHAKITAIWLRNLFNFIRRILNESIVPVFVFDGQPPPEKDATRAKRRDDKKKTMERIVELRIALRNQISMGQTLSPDLCDQLMTEYKKLTIIDDNDIYLFKSFVSAFGLPTITAKGEAEELCAVMCREQIVNAVYSTDTDALVHGAPLIIKDFEGKQTDPQTGASVEIITVVALPQILSDLQFTMQEFVDFCIMCGCDYNTNIYMIGVKKSCGLIEKHRSIDNLPDKYDVTCLNHHRCRELFATKSASSLYDVNTSLLINIKYMQEHGRDILDAHNASAYLRDLTDIYAKIPDHLKVVNKSLPKLKPKLSFITSSSSSPSPSPIPSSIPESGTTISPAGKMAALLVLK